VNNFRKFLSVMLAVLMVIPTGLPAANHREAPITSLDHKADITDVYAFVSYNDSSKVTLMLGVDPLLEPGNGPNWFPFDPEILYEIKVDNNFDAQEDVTFQFRFNTETRLPGAPVAYIGVGNGVAAPLNSPKPIAPGTPLLPPQIKDFSDAGLGQRQSYTVSVVRGRANRTEITNSNGSPFYAVPANVGPRTMDYNSLFTKGTYKSTSAAGVSVFAGTVDDPFWIDLGATFDSLNNRATGFLAPAVLTPAMDADDKNNYAADEVAGYAVNYIAIEVPITMLTSDGLLHPANDPKATIGMWGTTSRPRVSIRRPETNDFFRAQNQQTYVQVQRMGNPLINELIIGTGSKDRFSMDEPKNDSQFANFFLDPLLARVLNAATAGGVKIPEPPREDLLPLVVYAPPIAAAGTPAGPVADLLRLNTGVAATPVANIKRMGLLAGDPAGFPNGRRLEDDVTDIALRAVAGVLKGGQFAMFPNNSLGDGVNANDYAYRSSFPYLANAPDGRNSRHVDPGETGCAGVPGGICPVN
jgi:hypothetical protein